MQIFKPLSIAAALALGCAWGNVQAAQPAQPLAIPAVEINQAYPASVSISGKDYFLQRISDTHEYRKVYIFSKLDRNHDGQLSRSEIPKGMRLLRLQFVKADWNHNGRLSPEEYLMWSHHEIPQYTAIWHALVFVWN